MNKMLDVPVVYTQKKSRAIYTTKTASPPQFFPLQAKNCVIMEKNFRLN